MPDRSGEPRPGRDEPTETPPQAKRAAQAAARAALQADYAAEHHQRQQALETRAAAVRACNLCDTDGYRGMTVCDHIDHTAAHQAGIAAIRALLASQRPSTRHTPKKPPTAQPDGTTTPP